MRKLKQKRELELTAAADHHADAPAQHTENEGIQKP